VFVVSNGVFVGEKHPLYSKYANVTPQFPVLDRSMDFVNKMYFLNEEQTERKRVHAVSDVLNALVAQIELVARGLERDVEGGLSRAKAPPEVMERILSSGFARDVNRLRRIAQLDSLGPDMTNAPASASKEDAAGRQERSPAWAERQQLVARIEHLKREIKTLQSSRSWKITAPLRALAYRLRRFRG
jgi:hypothetical protein